MLNPCFICHAEPNSPAASLELAPPSDLYDALGEALRRVTPEDILGSSGTPACVQLMGKPL